MQELSATRTLYEATPVLKDLQLQAPDLTPVHELGRAALKAVLEERMRTCVQQFVWEARRRGEADRRNGSYRRWLLTSMGAIELVVPRTRRFNPVAVVRAYARREAEVDRLILACFVLGLSTRKVGTALLSILGERVSATTVSRVAKQLDAAVAAFHQRPLANRYRALLLDGVTLSRRTGAGAVRRPVLVALGITLEGRKEILDFRLARAESQAAWEAFLSDLHRRGMTGHGLTVIVTDGGAGLLAALPLVYPRARVQRCWAHKTRNVLDKVRFADRERVKRDLHRISHAPHRAAARSAARRFVERWNPRYPLAVRCLWQDLEELLTFFAFDDDAWRRATRTTNAIERRFREVRRRTRPMGVMADHYSVERILFAVFTHLNQSEGTASPFLLTQDS
jgi:transposase-like protein